MTAIAQASNCDIDDLDKYLQIIKNLKPLTFYQITLLPKDKNSLLELLLSNLLANSDLEQKKEVRSAILLLAQFQEDVGLEPITYSKGEKSEQISELLKIWFKETVFYQNLMVETEQNFSKVKKNNDLNKGDLVCVLAFVILIIYTMFLH